MTDTEKDYQAMVERKLLLESELKAINKYLMPQRNWKKEAMQCLERRGALMTTLEILGCIMGSEYFSLLSAKERSSQVTHLSVTMSNLNKGGYIKKIKIPGLKGYYYGLSSWFDEADRLKDEFNSSSFRTFSNNADRTVIEFA